MWFIYFHCRKWKAVSVMGPAGRVMGAFKGKKELEGGGREREALSDTIQWCQCASWAAEETTPAAPRWISMRKIWWLPGSLWDLMPPIPVFPGSSKRSHLHAGSLSTALCLPFRSGAWRRSSRLLQKRKLTKDKPLPSVSPIYIPELDFPSSRLWGFRSSLAPPPQNTLIHSLRFLPCALAF